MNKYLSIITSNVNGLNAPIKRHRKTEWIRKHDPHICCLPETHLRTCPFACDSPLSDREVKALSEGPHLTRGKSTLIVTGEFYERLVSLRAVELLLLLLNSTIWLFNTTQFTVIFHMHSVSCYSAQNKFPVWPCPSADTQSEVHPHCQPPRLRAVGAARSAVLYFQDRNPAHCTSVHNKSVFVEKGNGKKEQTHVKPFTCPGHLLGSVSSACSTNRLTTVTPSNSGTHSTLIIVQWGVTIIKWHCHGIYNLWEVLKMACLFKFIKPA